MEITAEKIKELRAVTGAGILDCRNALQQTGGDFDKAVELLREKGLATAAKKASREAREGIIGFYVHTGAKMAALVELNCETDFVARTPEFQQLARDLAMQVVAARPQYIRPEDVPTEVIERERQLYRSQLADSGKPEPVIERIIEGKLEKFYDEVCLLRQPFIRDEGITVQDLIAQSIAKLGENIVVRRFVRYELGQ
ncbi:MAG: translation elongation factor Ts [Anaerolineae bacterium]|nr:translation elongation factor Ts [Anaerolineae bacterium]MDW8097915.1 translation elongation factor Ts [Anaerolineae bacterium]